MSKCSLPLFMLSLSIALFFGCVSSNPLQGIAAFGQTAVEEYQTLEGVKTTESFVVVPVGASMKEDDDMGLKIGRISLNGKTEKYVFQAEVHTSRAFTFEDAISIELDDNIYELKDDKPDRHVLRDGYFLEVLAVEIPSEIVEKIRMAKKVSVELYKRAVTLNEKQLQEVKYFLQ